MSWNIEEKLCSFAIGNVVKGGDWKKEKLFENITVIIVEVFLSDISLLIYINKLDTYKLILFSTKALLHKFTNRLIGMVCVSRDFGILVQVFEYEGQLLTYTYNLSMRNTQF